LVDQEGKVINDSTSLVRIIQLNDVDKVYGTSALTLKNGIVEFKEVIFESIPGGTEISY